MPDKPKTPHRHLRVDDELWQHFSDAAKEANQDRSTLLRAFMRWYVGERGAKLPKRPDIPPR